MQHFELFINGKHGKPSSGKYRHDTVPAAEEPIAAVALGAKADVDVAVKAARAAQKGWAGMRAADRGRILQRAADLIEQHAEELIQIHGRDAGNSLAGVRRQDMPA